jgi:hypothetical protein
VVKLHGLLPCVLLLACGRLDATVLVARDAGTVEALDAALDEDAGEPLEAAAAEPPETDPGLADAASALDASASAGRCRIGGASEGFYDNFDGTALDPARWLVADGPVQFGGRSSAGSFAPDNVAVEGGALVLRVRGDRYGGPVRGRDESGALRADGRRSAAAVATRDLFASGTYQVQGRLSGPLPVELALWWVRDDDSEGALSESTPGALDGGPSYSRVRMESRSAAALEANDFALDADLADGASHILRFDWYTTTQNAVRFWVDDKARWAASSALPPRRAARLWIVAWLPSDAPADFDTAEIRIENAFITPFGNEGDQCEDGELSGPFLVLP